MWDSVPWFVGGGAQHSPEVARLLAFAATGGAQGVVTPADLKVSPLSVPGGAVRVAPGAGLILNRAAGGSQQTYVGRLPVEDVVQVASTGSGAGRSDLIVAQIEDPFMAGEPWQDPEDPTVGPYIFTRVIPNVPAGTRRLQDVPAYAGRSAFALARIDMPASTGTVTAGMVTDLRALAIGRSERQVVKGPAADATVTLSTSVWAPFPLNPITGIVVPEWATHAVVRAETTLLAVSGDSYANFQSFLGLPGVLDGTTLYSDSVIDSSGAGGYRQPLIMPSDGNWTVPASIRGQTVQLTSRVRGRANGGKIGTSVADYYFADITFVERVE